MIYFALLKHFFVILTLMLFCCAILPTLYFVVTEYLVKVVEWLFSVEHSYVLPEYIYRPHVNTFQLSPICTNNDSITHNEICKLFDINNCSNLPSIIIGDFNLPDIDWNFPNKNYTIVFKYNLLPIFRGAHY